MKYLDKFLDYLETDKLQKLQDENKLLNDELNSYKDKYNRLELPEE